MIALIIDEYISNYISGKIWTRDGIYVHRILFPILSERK